MEGTDHPVRLYVYDLTRGMAKQLAPMLIGRPLEGIWHTSVVVYGVEYYFSGFGVERSLPGKSHHGIPTRVDDMGTTPVPQDMFHTFITDLVDDFGPDKYHLLDNNCNHFTDRACELLIGRGIHADIVSMPQELINTPFGQMIRPLIEQTMGPSRIPNLVSAQSDAANSTQQM